MKNKLKTRINRDDIISIIDSHLISYPTPEDINYSWSFGFLSGITLLLQIVTGIFLSMHYTPEVNLAFDSIEHIMRNVNGGWFIRYAHANGSSFFFIVIYFHILKGLYYGSYLYPKRALWFSGIVIFLLTMATAFIGYVLPWGQMSYWGATVITNLFSALPQVGQSIVQWIWGGFAVGNSTLNRFFSLHFLFPFLICGVVFLHLVLLHRVGSTSPLGLTHKVNSISFYPYFFIKDLFALQIFLLIFAIVIFYFPNILGHPDNYIEANSLSTPAHITPEWYYTPDYAILRSFPNKLAGVVAMIAAILVLFLLPFIDTTKIRSGHFRKIYSTFLWIWVVNFIILGWIGQKPVESPYTEIGQVATFYYFLFLLVIIPLSGKIEDYGRKNWKVPVNGLLRAQIYRCIEIEAIITKEYLDDKKRYISYSNITGSSIHKQLTDLDIYYTVLKNEIEEKRLLKQKALNENQLSFKIWRLFKYIRIQ